MKEELNTLTSVNGNDSLVSGEIRKGEQLLKTKDIVGSPLTLKTTDEGSAIYLGVHRVSEWREDETELIDMVARRDYNLLLAIIGLTVELSKILNNQNQETSQNIAKGITGE